MITEKGTIKTSTPLTEQVHKELNKKPFVLSILYIVLGAIILALGFVVYLLTEDSYGIVLLACGTIILACGIIILVAVRSAKNLTLKRRKVDEAEFFRDHLMAYEYTDGELTTTSKIYYSWLIKIRETANYLFLYNTKATAVAVDKNSLPLNELSTIRMLLGRSAAGAAQVPVQVPEQSVETPTAAEVPPEEPFTDLKENKEE
ncbi:MAG: YcxB family protein [Clostridia bacterium]|nr:YcxB family protein [Clostridia bacterium]